MSNLCLIRIPTQLNCLRRILAWLDYDIIYVTSSLIQLLRPILRPINVTVLLIVFYTSNRQRTELDSN